MNRVARPPDRHSRGVRARAAGHGARLNLLDKKSDAPIEIEADDGIEWRQTDKVYIARGNVKIVRGDITIYSDSATAYYREAAAAKPGGRSPRTRRATRPTRCSAAAGTEIWKLDAVGHLRIETQGDQATAERGVYNVDLGVLTLSGGVKLASPGKNTTAYGDDAVYDTNQAVMVLTGRDLRFESPQNKITARDSLEYYDQKNLAVARGNALAVQEDKRVRADVLTAHLLQAQGAAPGGKTPPGKTAAGQGRRGQARFAGRPGPGRRGRAHGRVRQRHDVLKPVDRPRREGRFTPYQTGVAVLSGGVKITRGENQLNGETAEVNLNTGIQPHPQRHADRVCPQRSRARLVRPDQGAAARRRRRTDERDQAGARARRPLAAEAAAKPVQ